MSYSKRDILSKIILNGKDDNIVYLFGHSFKERYYLPLILEKDYNGNGVDFTMADKFTVIEEGSIYINNIYLRSSAFRGKGYGNFIIPPGSVFRRREFNDQTSILLEGDIKMLSYIVNLEEILSSRGTITRIREKIKPFIKGDFKLIFTDGDMGEDHKVLEICVFKNSELLIDVDKLLGIFNQELQMEVKKVMKRKGKLAIKNYSFINTDLSVTWSFKNYKGKFDRYRKDKKFEYDNLMDINDVLDKIGGNQ